MYTEKEVEFAKKDFEMALDDVRNDMGDEAAQQGAFDLSIGVALGHDQESAEEFLRREWGCVPEQYTEIKNVQARNLRERARREREALIRPDKRAEMKRRLAERKAERIKDR